MRNFKVVERSIIVMLLSKDVGKKTVDMHRFRINQQAALKKIDGLLAFFALIIQKASVLGLNKAVARVNLHMLQSE